jgi:threonine synthase
VQQGDFDDAQAIVKAAFADVSFREEVKLGAINSINWARVLAQITYYFYSWLRVTDNKSSAEAPHVNFAVPTGNFGDILAGYYAKRMGLPVDELVVCTNENDVLHRFMQSGIYRKSPATLTIAPSMDISVSSNFERYLYYLAGESSETLASWMDTFEATGVLSVPPTVLETAKQDFNSFASDKAVIVAAMKRLFEDPTTSYLACPHTATAVAAVNALKLPADRTVCLATAHPAKFEEAVGLALAGVAEEKRPPRPQQLEALFALPTRQTLLPNSLQDIEGFILSKLGKSKEANSEERGFDVGVSNLWQWTLAGTAFALAVAIVIVRSRK